MKFCTRFLILSFILILISHQPLCTDNTDKKPFSHCISISKEAIKKNITQQIDYLLDTDHQLHDLPEIRALKTIAISEIYSKIDAKCYISTLEVTQDIDNYVKDKLVQYIKAMAYKDGIEALIMLKPKPMLIYSLKIQLSKLLLKLEIDVLKIIMDLYEITGRHL